MTNTIFSVSEQQPLTPEELQEVIDKIKECFKSTAHKKSYLKGLTTNTLSLKNYYHFFMPGDEPYDDDDDAAFELAFKLADRVLFRINDEQKAKLTSVVARLYLSLGKSKMRIPFWEDILTGN